MDEWTTKQVSDIICREGGVRYHYTHVYRILHKWGFKQKVPRKDTSIQHQVKRKKISKKSQENTGHFNRKKRKGIYCSITR